MNPTSQREYIMRIDSLQEQLDLANKRLRWVSENIDTVANKWGSWESWDEYVKAIDGAMDDKN